MSLETLLIEKIKKNGPLTIAEYMEQCLYHPEYGYYMQHSPIGREGGFVTAPEISSLFGLVVRTAFESLITEYRLENTHLVDLGGGKGTLMRDMLQAPFPKRPAHIVEISPFLIKEQQTCLKDFEVQWHQDTKDLLKTVGENPIAIIGNEFLDAFPIHQYIFRKTGWRERVVALSPDDKFIFKTVPSDFSIDEGFGTPKVGSIAEQSPASHEYIAPLLLHIKKYGGIAIFIDYGYELFAYGDTFQAVELHKYSNPLEYPGKMDLTAHVDFYTLQNVVESFGLQTLPLVSQGSFLQHYGLEYYVARAFPQTDITGHRNIINAVARLVSSQDMGILFKVMIIAEET